ncbi:SDR family NAD(P)-dependent oxidoreductase [Novosphingobium sp. G106]|uniref:SDR family NAD(P)-dependent oxidoreductase n=1 Tax=Novosphingobium sp. G106 TaxID=2849500 RepID=UPI001C2D45E9|nr:SDR family NAD(P)-dependent oxidoreductase [Novosphingobium sp. G106]MBV1689254.1 SDR family NAD(P)-dependent oxidoreductase [Novosphingobium sp. G106]
MAQFGAETTTEDVLAGIDLTGKRVLVTGVSAGLGIETARAAAAHGAQVIGTARDLGKAATALAEHSELGIEVLECDLASLASVRGCADALLGRDEAFDVIIANAGVMNCPFGHTADGFETQFGTNHLGHFVLVNRLAPRLRPGGRVVIVSSSAHQFADVDLDDPGFEKTDYDPMVAYGRSKTANILFAVELDRRLRGRGICATALHPGGIMTELMRHTTPEMLQDMAAKAAGNAGARVKVKTVPQGAATSVWAAFVAPAEAIGGRYLVDCQVAEVASGREGVQAYAFDPERAKALWARSEEMVRERFPEA